jgi:hypothetical protein
MDEKPVDIRPVDILGDRLPEYSLAALITCGRNTYRLAYVQVLVE